MDATSEEITRGRVSASGGMLISAILGSVLLISGAGMQWGGPAAMMVGGVVCLIVAAFFNAAWLDLHRAQKR